MRQVQDMYSVVVVVSTLSVEPVVLCWENVVKMERMWVRGFHVEPWVPPLAALEE